MMMRLLFNNDYRVDRCFLFCHENRPDVGYELGGKIPVCHMNISQNLHEVIVGGLVLVLELLVPPHGLSESHTSEVSWSSKKKRENLKRYISLSKIKHVVALLTWGQLSHMESQSEDDISSKISSIYLCLPILPVCINANKIPVEITFHEQKGLKVVIGTK